MRRAARQRQRNDQRPATDLPIRGIEFDALPPGAFGANKVFDQMPKRKVFLRANQMAELNAKREFFITLHKTAIVLQSYWRGRVARKMYAQLRQEVAALNIQKKFQRYTGRKSYLTVRSVTVTLQMGLRAMVARDEFWYIMICDIGSVDVESDSNSDKNDLAIDLNGVGFLISNLQQLSKLDLHGNMFNGSIPISMASLTRLLLLNLSRNSVTGQIPAPVLASMKGVIPKSFERCRNLGTLDLSHNKISCPLPAEALVQMDFVTS